MSTPAPAGAYRVLVVEDEADLRAIVKHTLAPMEVVTAVHGLDALMKLDRVEPDFIVTDIMMPEMDGWEFVRRVRQRPGYEKTPVIYLTALSSRDDMKKGYETGADVYLTKPYEPQRLKRNLEVFTSKMAMGPRRKRFTIEEVLAEDSRLAQVPRPAPRTVRPPQPDLVIGPTAPPPDAVASAKATVAPPSPRPAPPVAEGKPRTRLLLVAADKTLVEELRAALPADRSEMAVAKDPPSAMDKISLYRPDAVFLHWQFRGHHGPVLAQLFSESPDCRRHPLIIVSDKRLSGAESRQIESFGAFDTLRRPLDPAALRDLLDDVDQVSDRAIRAKRLPWAEVERLEAGGALDHEGEPGWEG